MPVAEALTVTLSSRNKLRGIKANMCVFLESVCFFLVFFLTVSVSDNQLLIQLDAQKALVGATP